jgi:hypothetical protein
MRLATLTDYFAAIFVINLPERRDRRKAISGELERAGVPLCAGKVEIFPAERPKKAQGFPNTGARGCFLSHLHILQKALERGLPNVLIIEDDLVFSPDLNQRLDQVTKDLQSTNWGIVYLGHIEKISLLLTPGLIPYSHPVITSHFYAVNGPVIPRLVHYLEQVQTRQPGDPLGGPMHLDGALTMFREANPDVLTLLAHPNLGWQRPSRSNINCRWYERLPVVQQAADMARLVREYLRT